MQPHILEQMRRQAVQPFNRLAQVPVIDPIPPLPPDHRKEPASRVDLLWAHCGEMGGRGFGGVKCKLLVDLRGGFGEYLIEITVQ